MENRQHRADYIRMRVLMTARFYSTLQCACFRQPLALGNSQSVGVSRLERSCAPFVALGLGCSVMAPTELGTASGWPPGWIVLPSAATAMILLVIIGAAKACGKQKRSSKSKPRVNASKKSFKNLPPGTQSSRSSSSDNGCCGCCRKKKAKTKTVTPPKTKSIKRSPSVRTVSTNTTMSSDQEHTPRPRSPSAMTPKPVSQPEVRPIVEEYDQIWEANVKFAPSISLATWRNQVETSTGYRHVTDANFPAADAPSLILQSQLSERKTDKDVYSKGAGGDFPVTKSSTPSPEELLETQFPPDLKSVSIIAEGPSPPASSQVSTNIDRSVTLPTPKGQTSPRSTRLVKVPIHADPLSRSDRDDRRRKSIRQLEEHLSSPTGTFRKPRSPVSNAPSATESSPPALRAPKRPKGKKKQGRRKKKASKNEKARDRWSDIE